MVRRELTFLLAVWKANLLAAMEYRAAFLTQVVGLAPALAGTLLLVCFGWVLFNCADLGTAWVYLKRMFMFTAPGKGLSLLAVVLVVVQQVLEAPWRLRPS